MQQQKKTSFQDVRDEVMRRIEARVWDQGALLPTEADLAEEFGCARATVNRALRELADRGIIDRKRKSGTRVATLPVKQAKLEIATTRRLVEERNATYRYALVSRKIQAAPGWLSSQMNLPVDTRVLHMEVMHYADGQPFHLRIAGSILLQSLTVKQQIFPKRLRVSGCWLRCRSPMRRSASLPAQRTLRLRITWPAPRALHCFRWSVPPGFKSSP